MAKYKLSQYTEAVRDSLCKKSGIKVESVEFDRLVKCFRIHLRTKKYGITTVTVYVKSHRTGKYVNSVGTATYEIGGYFKVPFEIRRFDGQDNLNTTHQRLASGREIPDLLNIIRGFDIVNVAATSLKVR